MSAWSLVAAAVVAEVAAALFLRASHGFTRAVPATGAFVAFGAAFYLASRALLALPVSLVYPVWAGGGTAGVAVVAAIFFRERFPPRKLAGIVLVLAGIVVLNASGGGG